MALVSDILNDALIYIGALAAGETPSTDDQNLALRVANRALDQWSARKLTPLSLKNATYALSGAASYTYGPGQTWNATARPMKIKSASTIAANGVETPANIITSEEWVKVRDKTRTGRYVKYLVYDNGYPTGIIYTSPKVAAGNISLWTYEAVVNFVNVGDTINLPPGYLEPLVLMIAMTLCLPFGKPMPQALPAMAQEARQTILTLQSEILGLSPPPVPQEQAPPPHSAPAEASKA